MKIVSFSAPKQAGKDTAADLLIESKVFDGKLSFAAPLKEICSKVFELHLNMFNDVVLKEKELATPIVITAKHLRNVKNACADMLDPVKYGYNPNRATVNGLEGAVLKTPREILQFIGTNFIRDRIWDKWHATAAFSEERLANLNGNMYAVTDARFPNEYEFLVNRFGDSYEAFYIERKSAEEQLSKATHASELGVLEIKARLDDDHILKNNGTKEDFKKLLLSLKLSRPENTKTVSGKGKKGSRFKYVKAN